MAWHGAANLVEQFEKHDGILSCLARGRGGNPIPALESQLNLDKKARGAWRRDLLKKCQLYCAVHIALTTGDGARVNANCASPFVCCPMDTIAEWTTYLRSKNNYRISIKTFCMAETRATAGRTRG